MTSQFDLHIRAQLVDGLHADWKQNRENRWIAAVYCHPHTEQRLRVYAYRSTSGGLWSAHVDIGVLGLDRWTVITPSIVDGDGPYDAARKLRPHAERLVECLEGMEGDD